MRRWLALVFAIVGLIGVRAADGPYHPIAEIPIGGDGGWDYITVDSAAHRLYVSHATRVVVVDLDAAKVIGEIPDTEGVHGFAVAPELGLGFSSNGRANSSTRVDLKTLKAAGTVTTEANPDAILYEPSAKEVYTFNGRGHSATVFAAESGSVVATIPLGGKPEAAVIDTAGHRVFVNIEDTHQIAAIDLKTHRVASTWTIDQCEEPSGLAFDATSHRLFSACGNKVMAVTDSDTGKLVTSVPIGDGADGAAFDPATKYAFTSNGEGNVTIAHVDAPNTVTVVQTLPTVRSARTMALDPATHRIYLPAATLEPPKPGETGRPRPVAGTFRVLVYGMS